ncbi:hypothetical protein ACPPVW_05200 [Leifsonia sp. McL0607]|uniref:hypothetical protein n=1 Tax=Leifsonia sp. McL0607 TaxID=3415672 RepID=UPI003CF678E0
MTLPADPQNPAPEPHAEHQLSDAGEVVEPHEPLEVPAPKRTRRRWLKITAYSLLAAGGLAGSTWGWQFFATERITTAYREVIASSEELADVSLHRGAALDKARASVGSMAAFTESPRPDYLAESTATALADAQVNLKAKSEKYMHTEFERPQASPTTADLWPWTVIGDLQDKDELTHQNIANTKTRAAELKVLGNAQEPFEKSASAVYGELAAHAQEALTASPSATFESRLTLQHVMKLGDAGVTSSRFGGEGLVQLVEAIDGVQAAHAAGEAAKQDPAYPVRAQIEEYARSIARGVPLDFEWHEQVSGLGAGWYSGTAMYRETDGGWATIDLNFTVQEGWTAGDVDAKAVVTHEVGHAQVVRPECRPLFEGPAFNRDDEMWATAWTIGLGFDVMGAGIEAYGRPSDEQIAVAAQCR